MTVHLCNDHSYTWNLRVIMEQTICHPYTETTFVGHRRSQFPWSDIDGAGQTHMIPLRACGITGVTQ